MLKKLHLLLFTLITCAAFAQTFEGNAYLVTQAEVNEFGANGYKIITGNVSIGYDEESDITDLSPLESIEEIGGYFHIDAFQITSISGFNNLKEVGEYFLITGEEGCKVQTISGFDNLQRVGVYVVIDECEFLTSVEGFNNLTTVGYAVDEDGESTSFIGVFNNPSLVSVNAFDKVSKVLVVGIGDNPNLESITGFNNWEDMTESPLENGVFDFSEGVSIINNPKLSSINMFEKTRIANNMVIANIPLIENLNFLCAIEEVSAFEEGTDALITITATPTLTDCYALCGIPAYTNGHALSGGSGDCTDSFTLNSACENANDNCSGPSSTNNDSVSTITISPNPSYEYVRINGIESMSSVRLYSSTGVLVKTFETETNTKMELQDLNKGVYILRIMNQKSNEVQVVKIAKR